jgi:hypothetical protein
MKSSYFIIKNQRTSCSDWSLRAPATVRIFFKFSISLLVFVKSANKCNYFQELEASREKDQNWNMKAKLDKGKCIFSAL